MPYRWLAVAFVVIAKHRIEPHEVSQVLASSRRCGFTAYSDLGPLRSVWGVTKAGRRLIVVLRDADGLDKEIIGAREMTEAEAEVFDRWT